MTRDNEATITVADDADVIIAGRHVRAKLGELEFNDSAIEEIVLVVHELASNIVKHAGEGSITVVPCVAQGRHGIEIRAHDSGPGIADIDQAITDGYSTAGTLGGGLGAVHRLMDEVVINSTDGPGSGVQVVTTRWNGDRGSSSDEVDPPFAVGAATRAHPGSDQNGDAFLIEHGGGQTLVGLIDGLGHGVEAHRASSEAKQYVRKHSSQPLTELFAGVEQVCRATRGVVMLLARFEWDTDTVTLGSVGNITLRVCHSSEARHLMPRRGVVGANATSPTIEEWDWEPMAVMVMHSDGLRSRWQCDEFSLGGDRSETEIANELLQSLSTEDDDATVLVIRRTDR